MRRERRSTAPLDASTGERRGWPGREGIYTAHQTLESYRRTARETLLASTRRVHYTYGGALEAHGGDAAGPRLVRALRERLPELREVPVEGTWGGWIAYPLDFLPSFGWTGSHRRIAYALGYAGHGIAQATFMGEVLAELLEGRIHPEFVGVAS